MYFRNATSRSVYISYWEAVFEFGGLNKLVAILVKAGEAIKLPLSENDEWYVDEMDYTRCTKINMISPFVDHRGYSSPFVKKVIIDGFNFWILVENWTPNTMKSLEVEIPKNEKKKLTSASAVSG